MGDRLESVEKIVAKIEGNMNGNAFLVDKGHAITVKHCVVQDRVKLVFPKLFANRVVEVWAERDSEFNSQEDELVILELEEELEEPNILFASVQLQPSDEAKVFGYDANNRADGRWTDLVSAASIISNAELVQDMLFDLKTSRESNFSGLSGSPIIKGDYIIGIASQQSVENANAIAIHGISVQSCTAFFERYDINVVMGISDVGEYSFEPNLSIGEYEQKHKAISVAGVLEIQSRLQGMYKEILVDIIVRHRKGDVYGAWEALKKQIIELNKSPYISNEIKAEYYYRMALWFLEDRNDLGKAQKRYNKALELKPDLDGCIFQALKQSMLGDESNAEDLLEPVNSIGKFNVYLQICINTHKIGKAYAKYEELDQTIIMDTTTYYLLSILEILRRNYDVALRYIEKALEKEDRIPFYHLIKGIIMYWKALPQDLNLADDLYPVMFTNGLIHMNEYQCRMLQDASKAYRRAYQLAEYVENREQVEVILSIWINSLSVDSKLKNDIQEPLQLLKKKDPFNVTVLLYLLQKRMAIDDEITIESLEQHLKTSQNKIGHVIVLIELCLLKEDKRNAKRLLHEYRSLFFNGQHFDYWYEYIIKVEDKKDKLKEYEEEIKNNTELEEIRRKRLLCLFIQLDYEREQELEKILIDIYSQTNSRLDLLNLIAFCKSRRNWQGLLQYANTLVNQYNDVYGNIYKIQCLVELQKYDDALSEIEELENKKLPGIEIELWQNQMLVYEKLGKYTEAIEVGCKILQRKQTEQIILKLASIHALNGDESAVLNTLLKAEENNLLTVAICQRISTCYLTVDQRKAWEYARKAVKLSENQPEIKLWATNIANRVGRSDKVGEYFHQIMIENPNHQLLTVKNIDEVLEMIRVSNEEAEKRLQMLYAGDIPSHLFVDASHGTRTYAEYFYAQWDEGDMVPMEFGAHYYHDIVMNMEIRKIALDYSSCLLMHEMGILEILCESMEEIYVPGVLFGVISEELRKIPVNQPDLINSRYQTLKKCKEELQVFFVEMKIPDALEGLDAIQRSNAVNAYTAECYEAVWVSEDVTENSINEVEVIAALYRKGKITKETAESCGLSNSTLREEIVQDLMQKSARLFVNDSVIMKWDTEYLLPVICENFQILVDNEMVQTIEQEHSQIEHKEHICAQVQTLRDILLNQKDKGKMKFLPMMEQREGMDYSNMLASILCAAEKRNLPVCIDDRMLTSYSKVGNAPIYNSFDMMKMLFSVKRIRLEQYSVLYKKAIDKKIRYILPDVQVILYALNLSEVDMESGILKEADMLTSIRKYVVEALSPGSFMRRKEIAHVPIPEWEYYIFHLQNRSRELIRLIWHSEMGYDKKCAASEWTLCHYSQFAFDFSEKVNEKGRKSSYAIQLADFLLGGILLGTDEQCIKLYYTWLYEWFDNYLRVNSDIKLKTLNYTQEFIVSFLRDAAKMENRQEMAIVNLMIATGIYFMPEEYKAFMLANDTISKVYDSIYCEMSIVLTQKRQIPVEIFRAWEKEVLAINEEEILTKKYKDISFDFSWEYIIPSFPGLNIKWKEGTDESVKRVFMDRGARLNHEDRSIRKKEFRYIEPYLEGFDYGKQYLALQSQSKYPEAAKEILQLLDMSEHFEQVRIERGLMDNWLGGKDTRKLMLPAQPDFFKQLYDCNARQDDFYVKENLALPLHFGLVKQEHEVDNHNPIRLLHKLESLLSYTEEGEIYTVIDSLFSYTSDEYGKYGQIFIIFLKSVWILFHEVNAYKEEADKNLLIWAYIWSDMLMTGLTKLEAKGIIDVAEYVEQLENDTGIDVRMDGFWESMEQQDILSPIHMNLYKLCITGTLAICNCHEERMQHMAGVILDKLESCYSDWMQTPIHFRESELLHQNDKNIFGTIFNKNFYSLVEELAIKGDCIDKISVWVPQKAVGNRVKFLLQSILSGNGVGMEATVYMFLISRENMEEEHVIMIRDIIKEQVLGQAFQSDQIQQRFLAYIVRELPEDFQKEYVQHECKRVGELLHTQKLQWEEAYELVGEIAQISCVEDILRFWETYADELDASVALHVAERIAWLQRTIPYEYAEHARKLRMQLELKE